MAVKNGLYLERLDSAGKSNGAFRIPTPNGPLGHLAGLQQIPATLTKSHDPTLQMVLFSHKRSAMSTIIRLPNPDIKHTSAPVNHRSYGI